MWKPYRRLHIGEIVFFNNKKKTIIRETFKTPALIVRTLSQNGVGWPTQILNLALNIEMTSLGFPNWEPYKRGTNTNTCKKKNADRIYTW